MALLGLIDTRKLEEFASALRHLRPAGS